MIVEHLELEIMTRLFRGILVDLRIELPLSNRNRRATKLHTSYKLWKTEKEISKYPFDCLRAA